MYENQIMNDTKEVILDSKDWTKCSRQHEFNVRSAFAYMNNNRLKLVELSEWPEGVEWTPGENWTLAVAKHDAPQKSSLQGLAEETLHMGKRGTHFAIEQLEVRKSKSGRRFFVLVKFRYEQMKE